MKPIDSTPSKATHPVATEPGAAAHEKDSVHESNPLRRLERALCWIAILAGLLWRLSLSTESFDREFDGFQGSVFAVCAINYERLGFGAMGGYPVVNLSAQPEQPQTWYPYPNHSPVVPWLAWASARLIGPEGWAEAWERGEAPLGIEFAIRLPFLLAYALALLGLILLLRNLGAPRAAPIAGALFALAPAGVLYGGLANYENPSLAALLLGLAAFAAYLRAPRLGRLALACLGCAAATSVTFAPAFFLPFVLLLAMSERGLRGLLAGGAVALCALAPIAIHGFASARVLKSLGAAPGGLVQRAEHLFAPLLDGSVPLSTWLGTQGQALTSHFGIGLSIFLGAGALIAALQALLPGSHRRAARGVWLLLAGGTLVQLGFYRHTADPQENFLMNLLPGACAAAALLIIQLSNLIERVLRSPMTVFATLTPALTLLAIEADRLVERFRGSHQPLPIEIGKECARILPPGTIGWYPSPLGFNHATFFYAWRTMIPVSAATENSPETYTPATANAKSVGLGDAPVSLVLPNHIAPHLQASIDSIAEDLEGIRPGILDREAERSENYHTFVLLP